MRSQEGNAAIAYEAFEAGRHLPGVVEVCRPPGWSTFAADPELTRTALSDPGATTVVAVRDGGVVGFTGRRLVEEAFGRSGGGRVEQTSGSEGFYESLPHEARSGFRIYAARREEKT